MLLYHTVTVRWEGDAARKTVVLKAERGENLLRLLQRSDIGILAPCGGGGRCGKCLVYLGAAEGAAPPPLPDPIPALLSQEAIAEGRRLACGVAVDRDLVVTILGEGGAAKIATAGISRKVRFAPYVQKRALTLPKPSLLDQRPDAERVADAVRIAAKAAGAAASAAELASNASESASKAANSAAAFEFNAPLLRRLPGLLRAADYRITCLCVGGRVAAVEPGDTSARCFGVAFDVGTTTIAAYLYRLSDGARLGIRSALNPQAKYGADVITRINHTMTQDQRGLADMRESLLSALNQLLADFSARNGVPPNEIAAVFLVGNTTMLHFFMGLPAAGIAVSPFVPVTTGLCVLPAADSGLRMAPDGVAVCLPGLSGYVGPDTLAAALACGFGGSGKVNLLVDLGTNGEIVLGGRERLFACSTAAGPAFEGASIHSGVGGVEGAVDSVEIGADGALRLTTIGGAAAVGLCGSGLVDAIAQLLAFGLIDETGRLESADEARARGLPAALCERLIPLEDGKDGKDGGGKSGGRAFLLQKKGAAHAAHMDIMITQRDVRELQSAKAAIAAGIRTLLKTAGIAARDVRRVYLAGGFGSYVRVSSATAIGLIPPEFSGRVVAAGNAAGAGAVEAMLSARAIRELLRLKGKMRYLELSSSPAFTEAYVDCMAFE